MDNIQTLSSSSFRIIIIGAGNLAWSLIPNLQKLGITIHQLISRDRKKLLLFQQEYKIQKVTNRIEDVSKEGNLVFLTVPDDSISEVVTSLPDTNALLIHCSGSTNLETIQSIKENVAIFYPLQTFTIGKLVPFSHTPIFLEGKGESFENLRSLAQQLSAHVFTLSSEERLHLHLGAVFVSNFINQLLTITEEFILKEQNLSLKLYEPLLLQQIKKALDLGAQKSQTGPAKRGDIDTLRKHMKLLEQQPSLHQLYKNMSLLINQNLPFD